MKKNISTRWILTPDYTVFLHICFLTLSTHSLKLTWPACCTQHPSIMLNRSSELYASSHSERYTLQDSRYTSRCSNRWHWHPASHHGWRPPDLLGTWARCPSSTMTSGRASPKCAATQALFRPAEARSRK